MHSASPRHGFRPSWPKVALATVGVGVLLLVSASAALADCPITDPTCVTENAPDVNPPAAPSLPPVVDDLEKAADDAVNQAKDAVGQVEDTVGGILDPGGGGGGGTVPGEGPGNEAPGEGGTSQGPGANSGSPLFQNGQGQPGPLSPTSSTVPQEPPDLLGRIGGIAAETARRFGFPLALTLIVVGFVAFQNYLDRKDPKLALAPIVPEVMRFR